MNMEAGSANEQALESVAERGPRPGASVTGAARIVFLGGAPRSGTTLVQNILDSHPEVLGGPEFLHVPDVVALRDKLQGSVGRGWIDVICSAAEVDTEIRRLLTNLLLGFADRHGARLLSEKTPENVLVFPRLLELFPESKLIFVVRDPRGTIASMLAVGERARTKGEAPAPFTANVQAAIAYLRRCLEAGFKAAQAAPERVHIVVYEQLVRDPEGESRRLCDFLGIEWHGDMLHPGEKSHLGEAAITVNSKEIWYDARTYNSNPNTESVDKWRDMLAPWQRLLIARVFGSFEPLTRLGYRLDDEALHGGGRQVAELQAAWADLRIRVGNRLQRMLRRWL
jgi:hypothetical protein